MEENKKDTRNFKNYLQKVDQFMEKGTVRNFLEEMNAFFHKHSNSIFSSFPVDMYETENELVIKAELPGIHKEQIFIDTLGTHVKISIRYDSTFEEENTLSNYHRKERSSSYSERLIKVPYLVDKKNSKASFQNGILEIRAPKQAFPNETIEIY
ncbi:Hsp20/alpha crystallin family protein [Priestia taiwanensis]|uniref:Molecular chaperone Hsp20 n=1 Tax=Priestia taiwanensis TaxID=1347902 RepID=A0A917AKR4_9BACI|nr:Hsp20/alpha crystallin family protein [Priestia taiwanensis]MBM7362084.1 HSP20 family molecular chaperone IbpA [Priestia taiwanensis]GGE59330.1 molecular chaperone Hsp20 [Priestia taiwanensis]